MHTWDEALYECVRRGQWELKGQGHRSESWDRIKKKWKSIEFENGIGPMALAHLF